jgi:hypothetical protein
MRAEPHKFIPALTAGFAIINFEDNQQYKSLLDDQFFSFDTELKVNPYLGVGINLGNSFRINFASVFYGLRDPNGFSDKVKLANRWMFGISFDPRIRALYNNIQNALKTNVVAPKS